jgi:hypothetical protein
LQLIKENKMAAHNDITGDLIQSRVNSKQFEDNFDLIFRNKDPICNICGKGLASTKECAFTGCPLHWDEDRIDIIAANGDGFPGGNHYEANNNIQNKGE